MAKTDLEVTVMRKGRPEDTLDVHADINDIATVRELLTGWLAGNGWSRALWPQFSADVRLPGTHKVRKTVRAV